MSDIRFNQWLHQSGTGGVSQSDGGHVGIGTTNPLIPVGAGNTHILNVGVVTCNNIAAGSSITAGTFYGSGANLSSLNVTAIKSGGSVKAQANADGVFVTGILTATNFKTGVSNLHNLGLTLSSGQLDIGSNIKAGNAGVVTATSFSGSGANLTSLPAAQLTGALPAISGANLTGLPAGLGTALSSTQTSPLNKLYYTDRVLSIGSTVTIDHPASATGAYTHYADIQVEDDADLIVADGDDLIPDILGLGGNGTTGAGGAGRLLVDNIVNRSGTGAPTLPNGAVVTGVCTATTFSGSGANLTNIPSAQLSGALPAIDGSNLTGISAGVVKAAVRRYYGTAQTTNISNSGFTQINVAYVDIVPTSASNYIKLGGLFTWDGSDTEPTYSFRWKKVITGGSTTSIDSGQGSGNRVGITYKVSGNGGLACMNLDSIYDLAGTTSSIRYYLEVFVDGAGQTLWVNRTHADLNDPRDERGASYFVAEEINNSIFTFTNNS